MAIHHRQPSSTNPLFQQRNGQNPSSLQRQLHLLGMLNRSTMILNNDAAAAAAKDTRKRKMKGIAEEITELAPTPPAATSKRNIFSLQGQAPAFGSSSTAPPKPNQSYVQQILNATSPLKKPLTFTSLLNGKELHDVPNHAPFADLKFQTEQIDHTIAFYNENMKRALMGIMEKQQREMEETATKKLKEKEMEMYKKNADLDFKVQHYKKEAERLKQKVMYLEQVTDSLRDNLREAMSARRYAEVEEEDGESSFVDLECVDPVKLDCKACKSKVANVMLWPCRHVCVCKQCEVGTKKCPVCGTIATTSVEIFLPHN